MRILLFLALGLAMRAFAGEQEIPEAEHSAASAGGSTSLPVLPVVEKPTPREPRTGLKGDVHLDKTPVRKSRGLDLVKMGWTYDCMECHRLLKPRWHYEDRPMVEHGDIVLDHGNNRFCLNCHHPENRNAFVDYDGAEIPEKNVVSLCAKCHGPTHRDWNAGAHGRRNGYWNTSMGTQTRLKCIQCHDPHEPEFGAMKPLSPPSYPKRARGARSKTHAAAAEAAHEASRTEEPAEK